MEKAKKFAVIICFALIIFGLGIAHFVLPDGAVSKVERRKLAQFPKITASAVFSAEYSKNLEKYLLDQFPARDSFRTTKAVFSKDILRLSDNNDIYTVGNGVYKLEYPMKQDQILMGTKKIEAIISAHPEIGKAYYSIIPDKNYFAAAQNGYPSIDYAEMRKFVQNNIKSAEYIDIFESLTIEDYYRTDTHWRQEKIHSVVERLCKAMGVPCAPEADYKENTLSPFYGVYAGQSALPLASESIVYLTSAATENAKVTSVEHDAPISTYTLEDFNGNDPYDIFLSGAEAVVTIENPDAKTDKELVIFRDSFGSSITPLLIDSYAKITMLDLRYIRTELISDYANFDGADVLFLYSTMLINSAGILK
ncbi:MAG: DHHW family protein [Oscillospiraceae bacterium]